MSERIADEDSLRAIFESVEVPAGLDKWWGRVADDLGRSADAVARLPEYWLRPARRSWLRSVPAVAAATAVVGLGGVVAAGQILTEMSQAASGAPAMPHVSGAGVAGGQDDGENPTSEPVWGPMVGDPTGDNTGVPVGAALDAHSGDLVLDTPGAIVKDLQVTGSVIVTASNVTLRRVLVVADGGTAVHQRATNLSIVDSELYGATSLAQDVPGLTIIRSRLDAGVSLAAGATVVDSFLGSANALVAGGAVTVSLRHNTLGVVTMDDHPAPIARVTLTNNLLRGVEAPTRTGSTSIHVLDNRFTDSGTSTGWDPRAPDFRWSGNTFANSGRPADP